MSRVENARIHIDEVVPKVKNSRSAAGIYYCEWACKLHLVNMQHWYNVHFVWSLGNCEGPTHTF